jgi:hypothetical protein
LEEKQGYIVKITPEAEFYYFEVLRYFYSHHSTQSAARKSDELLNEAISLESNPTRGRIEEKLSFLDRTHRFILYYYTKRKAIKIIYFIDEPAKTVYVTDLFPCESDDEKIKSRS